MDQTHIHLLITHLPIFGSILGALVLIQGLWTKSNHTIIAAYTLFLCSSAGTGIAYLTGEGAEETVENIQGIAENAVEQHEDFAVIALVSFIILGLASIAGLLAEYKKSTWSRKLAWGILLVSLVSFALAARTGYLGGKIRHTEINAASQPAQQEGGEPGEDE